MECKNIRERLAAYLEGVVSPGEKRLIEEHLPSCQPCAAILEDLRRTEEIVKGLEEVEVPAWLGPKVMVRIKAEEESKKGILRRLFYPLHIKIPIEAFATILIAVMVIYVFKAVEPEIKSIPLPPAADQVASRDEPSERQPGPAPDSPAMKGKGILPGPQEPVQEKPLAQAEVEQEKGVFREDKKDLLKAEGDRPPAPEPPLESILAKKKEAHEEVTGRVEPSRQQGIIQEQYSPGPATKEAGKRAAERVAAMEARESKALAAGPQSPRQETVADKKGNEIGVRIRVRDVRTASGEVEGLLRQMGAEKIGKESLQGTEVLTGEVKNERIKELFEKLHLIGEVKEGVPSDLPKGETRVRVEIVRHP